MTGSIKGKGSRLRAALVLTLKACVSLGIVAYLVRQIDGRAFWSMAGAISVVWLVPALLVQGSAIACNILRWRLLLRGQKLDVPARHLVGSFLVGRFIGIVMPGTLGLDAYRAYDIARHARAPAKSLVVIGVEKLIGLFALGLLILAVLPGAPHFLPDRVPLELLLVVAATFVVPVALAFYLLVRPGAVQAIASRVIPDWFGLRTKIWSAAEAAGAYSGRRGILAGATGFGICVHLLTALVYLFVLWAVGAEVTAAYMIFVAVLTGVPTAIPIHISGIGVRELTLAFFLVHVGVPLEQAVLLGVLRLCVGESFSLLGGLVFLARGRGYAPEIRELSAGLRAEDLDDDTAAEENDLSGVTGPRPVGGRP